MTAQNFSSIPVADLLRQLDCSENGLSSTIANEKIKQQSVALKTERRSAKELRLFVRQFTNPLVMLLVIAVILSAIAGESSDSMIILFILLTTGILGYLQESNAGRAMEKLRKMIATKHTVLRDGMQVEVTTGEVVAGDVLLLDAGDIIPADCRILESNELHVNESSLTGESMPVEKLEGIVPEDLPLSKKTNCLWQGTNVISGTAKVIVFATGVDTIFGSMAHSLVQTPETAFEKGIKRFGFFLLRITVVLSVVILLVNLYFKKPFFDSILFSLALAVGMAPELLPAIMTFAMSAGAKRMLKKKVIVKKLSSIFNFGEVNVLCTDKTGTITEGNVSVKDIVHCDEKTSERIRLYAYLNASLQNGFSNPVDDAICSLKLPAEEYQKLNEIPYDFIRKRLSVLVKSTNENFFVTKGALQNVLSVCNKVETDSGNILQLDEIQYGAIHKKFIDLSSQGYRVLGLAYKKTSKEKIVRNDEDQMIFLGFILLEDPLKESAVASLKKLQEQHISVKIITGDNRYAALHVAKEIGLENPVILSGDELRKLSSEAFVVKARSTHVFAEIEPQQKEFIIKSLQKSNLIVAYIGDGINDVAAINAADIGISTNNAVDVAKDAADFVLIEKDLSVLSDGVEEGRRSFINSMKYIFITSGATFGNMFSVAGASLVLPFMPMLPKQILLTNLLTDLPFLTIASDHVDKYELLKPGEWNLKMIRNYMIVFGLHSSIFDFVTFYTLFYYFKLSNATFQTGWFLESAVTELLILYIIRTKKSFIRSKPGRLLIYTGIISFFATIILPFSPFADMLGLTSIDSKVSVSLLVIVVVYALTADLLKVIFFRMQKSDKKGIEK